MTGEVHRGANDMLVWGMLPGGVGYLNVRAMAGYTEDGNAPEIAQLDALDEALDCAMEDLADARAMIVDVRFNGGGWDPAAVRIANHFADRRRPAFSKQARTAAGFTPATTVYVEPDGSRQFTGPTLLLTSPLTASAAEIFTFCMKALPHVQQAGLPTMGIHSDMLVRHLPNGWTFSLSNEVYRFVDGKVYEKVGIPPGIEIPMFTGNDLADGKDQIVQRALQLLGEQATSKAR
jgi:C-terminal processing protease CtpA/Prc